MTKRFEDLSDFIRNQMRMSHIYQPAMLVELLQNGGQASVTEIAKALLSRDISQIEYYEQITKNMVGRVLTKNRGITDKDGNTYPTLVPYYPHPYSQLGKPIAWSGKLELSFYLDNRIPWKPQMHENK